jgi:hypothetical protein
MLEPRAKAIAQQVQLSAGGGLDVGIVERNPVALLLDYLQRPNAADWQRVVLSVVGGIAAGGLQAVDRSGLAAALDDALAARDVLLASPSSDAVAMVGSYVTPGGLMLTAVLDATDPNAEKWTALAVLPDSDDAIRESDHQSRWADWLPWCNLLQFLGLPHENRAAVMAGSSQAQLGDHDDLWIRYVAREPTAAGIPAEEVPAPAAIELSADQREQLGLIAADLRPLVQSALEAGAPDVVAGHEAEDGSIIEAAWPQQRVGVVVDDVAAPDGWDARTLSKWTIDGLLAALKERM